ncbi:Endoplasmic reticulum-Golgi intermediate compartment protein 3 [Taenia crassiceps]|uniref:Endoplasmic reticulum-Golgi intermediate compartment protein 3 n=1 Tax=Taenia crassiceps TaxID=6207 RepID=A0ABR4QJM4_9CEST
MPPALLFRSLRRFDAFAKPLKDFRIQTVSGALLLSVDSMDISGEQHSAITKEVNKTRVLSDGSFIDSGVEDNQCCNSCESVLEAYRVRGWSVPDPDVFEQCKDEKEAGSLAAIGQEGCRLVGQLGVNKVAGAFHIAPGKSYGQGHVHVHDLMAFSGKQFVLDHQIRRLSFGDTYPGQINPLDNTNMSDSTKSAMFSYFLKLVPTIYSDFSEKPLVTNQYSATWQVKSTPLTGGSEGIPGVFFNYQISPLLVKLARERKSFLHFLTNTCAIVGGVYTVASLLDAFVYRSSCFLAKLR